MPTINAITPNHQSPSNYGSHPLAHIRQDMLSLLQASKQTLMQCVQAIAGDMAKILTIGRKGIKPSTGGYHSGSGAAYGQPPQQKKPHHGGDPKTGGIYTPSSKESGHWRR